MKMKLRKKRNVELKGFCRTQIDSTSSQNQKIPKPEKFTMKTANEKIIPNVHILKIVKCARARIFDVEEPSQWDPQSRHQCPS